MNIAKVFLTLLLLLALVGGCKQGVDERCEWDNDCQDGLICCAGSNVCKESCTEADAAVTPQQDAEVTQQDAEVTQQDAEVTQDASP